MSVRLFGIDFTDGDAGDVLAAAAVPVPSRPRLIVTANMDHIISLSESAPFRRAYAGAAARTFDGMPLVWLARLRGDRSAVRVTGHDVLARVLAEPFMAEARIFLVCASTRIGEAAAARIVRDGAAPDAVAFAVPPAWFERDGAYSVDLARRVRAHGTTLLIMGIGAPKSEIWVDQQGSRLGTPLVLAVGDALSVAAGLQPRAPAVMQRNGLEWLFRFSREPRRLFHRYFVRSWRFLVLVGTGFSVARAEPKGRGEGEEVSAKV